MSSRLYVAEVDHHRESLAREHLRQQGFIALYPTFVRHRTVRNEIVEVEMPSISGYIFIEFDVSVHRWRTINGTRGVKRLMTDGVNGTRPIPIREREEVILRSMCEDGPGSDPDDFFAKLMPGDWVRVRAGHVLFDERGRFNGWKNGGEAKVVFTCLFGGRETEIKMDRAFLEVEGRAA